MRRVTWVAGMVVLAACASGGTARFKVRIETPGVEGAQVRIDSTERGAPPPVCSAPCSVELDAGADKTVTVVAPGYYPAHFTITSTEAVNTANSQDVKEPVLVVPLEPVTR